MTVRELIKMLRKQDQDAEVVCKEPEMGFVSSANVYGSVPDYTDWVSVERKPRPKKMVLIS